MLFHKKYIISCKSKFKKLSLCEVGGKGYNLSKLYYNKINIPSWFIISTYLFNEVIEPYKTKINKLIKAINFFDHFSIEKTACDIRSLILNAEFPDGFPKQLTKEYNKIIGKNGFASVRSSVVDEDSEDNSFAGQMDSYLNIPANRILLAIKNVWASAFSSNVLLYRYKKNLNLTEISAAVIIQKMVNSYSSGIIFTKNPENNINEIVISAGYGLGEGVVQNIVETDTYIVNRATMEVNYEISEKDLQIVTDDKKGTQKKILPPEMKFSKVLTENQIHNLIKEAEKIEKLYNRPIDIEWAIDKDGIFYILQARPILKQSTKEEIFILDNSNIAESYPGLTLPLTFSFVLYGYENHFRNATLGLLYNKKEIGKDLHIFKNMLCLHNGTVYYNLLNWYKMLSYFPGFKRYKKRWEQMIGINEELEFPQNQTSLVNKIYSSFKLIWILLNINGNANSFYKYFNPAYQRYKDIDYTKKNIHEVTELYYSLEKELLPKWYYTLYNDLCAMKYYDWLKALCEKWGLEQFSGLQNKLLSGERNLESVSVVRSLIRITELIKSVKIYTELFKEEDNNSTWQSLLNNSKYEKLKQMIFDYLKEYGDRSPEELKLENSTYREKPVQIISLLKTYLLRDIAIDKFSSSEHQIRIEALKKVKTVIKNPFKYLLFRFVLHKTRLSIKNRENMRFARSRLFGLVRQMFKRIATEFVFQSIISEEEDLYYLTYDEIFNFIKRTSYYKNLKDIISLRKKEYSEYSKIKIKDRIIIKGFPNENIELEAPNNSNINKSLKGIGCSSGRARAHARVTLEVKNIKNYGDYILIAKTTDPGWVFLIISSKGVVAEKGSLLSHTAIICRELGIPSVVNVKNATTLITDNSMIEIDGGTGDVKCL